MICEKTFKYFKNFKYCIVWLKMNGVVEVQTIRFEPKNTSECVHIRLLFAN